ncbi:sialate O-acetylesterase [Hahella ganghwensis]|uniref:sialate O-acetylesterase n=1 Tax=Hahella ganghwensis TaxID=286420 RepID=UPI00036BBBC3|nr:sialate O-acetylesterase [Hahella ganghwensis]
MAEYALIFDGSNDHVVMPTWTPSSERWEIRVKFELSALALTYILGDSSSSNKRLYVNPGSSPDVRVQGGGSSHRVDFNSGITWQTGVVYELHVIVDYNGFDYTSELYIDSGSGPQLVDSGTDGSGAFSFEWIGRRSSATYGQFKLHELELVDTDTGSNSRLYPVNEGTGSTIADSLGNGSTDGTLTNFPTDDSQWEFVASSNNLVATLSPFTAAIQASFIPPDGSADVVATLAPFTASLTASHVLPDGVKNYTFDDLQFPADWTEDNGQFTAASGVLQATGSSPTGAKWVSTFDAEASDGTLTAKFNSGGDSAGFYGLVCRYSDTSNFWLVCIYILSSSEAELRLYRRQSSAWTSVQSYVIPSFGRFDDYDVSVTLDGPDITAHINEVEAFTHSSSFLQSATRMGMRASGTAPSLDNVRFVTAPEVPLTINDYVFRRSVGGTATVPVSGLLNVSTSAIEYRLDGGSWQTAISSPSTGPYSFDTVLAKGHHSVEVRLADDTDTTATANYISVVRVIAGIGQSNCSGRGDNLQIYARGAGGERHLLFTNADLYQELEDAWDSDVDQVDTVSADPGAAGSFMLRFAHHAMAGNSEPLGFVPCPLGATKIGVWQKGGALYTSFARRVNEVGGVDVVIFHQGESNSNDTDLAADYETDLNQLVNDIYADFGAITIIVAMQTIHSTSDGNGTTTGQEPIRLAQEAVAASNPHAFITASNRDIDVDVTGDGLHLKTDTDIDTVGYRTYQRYASAVGSEVEQSLSPNWNVYNGVEAELSTSWTVYNVVEQSLALSWPVYNTVQNGSSISWSVLNSVESSIPLAWSVESPNSVSRSLSLGWDVFNAVSQRATLSWSVYNAVDQGLMMGWSIFGAVSNSLQVEWDVFQSVDNEMSLSWLVGGSVERALNLSWTVQSDAFTPPRNLVLVLNSKRVVTVES